MRKEDRNGLEIRLSVLEEMKPESEDDQRSIERNIRHVRRALAEPSCQFVPCRCNMCRTLEAQ